MKLASVFTAEFVYRGRKFIQSGLPDREAAKHWIQSEQLRLRREAVGYVKPMHNTKVAPLIDQYTAYLESRGRDSMYVYIAGKRLARLSADCGWMTLGNLTEKSMEDWLADDQYHVHGKRKTLLKSKTKNQYAQTAQEFCKWLVKPARLIPASPLATLQLLAAKVNEEYRRAATLEELEKILAAAPERRAELLFRIYQSNIRRRTLRGLEFGMCHLDAAPPFIKVPSHLDKSRKEKKYVLRYEIAQEIRAEKKRRKAKADDLVFPRVATVEDLRGILATAGVEFELSKGKRRLDFHALRRTLVRIGKNAGLSLEQVANLLGHRSLETTRRYYDEDLIAPELGTSMEKLPSLGKVRSA